jgi:hypothetical protein
LKEDQTMASKKLILTLLCVAALTFAVTGCGDDDSSPTAPAVDTAPPALPSGLTADYAPGSDSATLSWDPNTTDSDFAGFLVSRSSYDMDPEALVSEPQAASSYEDDDLASVGRLVTYWVYSVDRSGNVSAAASLTIEQDAAPAPAGDGRDYQLD